MAKAKSELPETVGEILAPRGRRNLGMKPDCLNEAGIFCSLGSALPGKPPLRMLGSDILRCHLGLYFRGMVGKRKECLWRGQSLRGVIF